MKRLKSILIFLAFFVSLYGCGSRGTESTALPKESKQYYDPFGWVYPVLQAEHGEDYVIQWEDEGVEAHVRFWLDKPEGDIYHSDVWDIRWVNILSYSAFDTVLTEPPAGNYFVIQDISSNKSLWNYTKGKLPDIVTLRDFRHFDSLQILEIEMLSQEKKLTDLSGPEECPNLQKLSISYAQPEDLSPLSKMRSLDFLSLNNCGTLDLAPLAELTGLTGIQLIGTDFETLEPLAQLPLKNLCLWCSMDTRQMRNHLDYTPVTRMKDLLYLDMISTAGFTTSDAEMILDALPNLETLNLSLTTASRDLEALSAQYPDVRMICTDVLNTSETVVK